MTADTQPATRPVDGRRFRAAVRLPVGGKKRLRVVALLGALADAGQETTDARELAARLGWDHRKVGALLLRLEADGHVERSRTTARRQWPRYRVVLDTETAAA